MAVRAKFRVTQLSETAGYAAGQPSQKSVTLSPASGEDNKQWSKWTPSGSIQMTIDNPAALEQFKIGEYFYVDFNPAPEKDPA